MLERNIIGVTFCITLIGIIVFALYYEPEFQPTTIEALLHSTKKETKGIISARIDSVLKNSPSTQLIINDGVKANVYYPKETTFAKNDFLVLYVVKEDNNQLYAYKVIKDA